MVIFGASKNGEKQVGSIFGVVFHCFRAVFNQRKAVPCYFEMWGKSNPSQKKLKNGHFLGEKVTFFGKKFAFLSENS